MSLGQCASSSVTVTVTITKCHIFTTRGLQLKNPFFRARGLARRWFATCIRGSAAANALPTCRGRFSSPDASYATGSRPVGPAAQAASCIAAHGVMLCPRQTPFALLSPLWMASMLGVLTARNQISYRCTESVTAHGLHILKNVFRVINHLQRTPARPNNS